MSAEQLLHKNGEHWGSGVNSSIPYTCLGLLQRKMPLSRMLELGQVSCVESVWAKE